MSLPLLSARELTLAYEKRNGSHESNQPILDGLSLTVATGELVAVVGASGSGKSSLLRVLAGLQRPTRGNVEINDISVEGPHPHIAIAFQKPVFCPGFQSRRTLRSASTSRISRASRAPNVRSA